jgi:hypothetical protein
MIVMVRVLSHSVEGLLKPDKVPELYLKRSYSGLLWDALDREYQRTAPEARV